MKSKSRNEGGREDYLFLAICFLLPLSPSLSLSPCLHIYIVNIYIYMCVCVYVCIYTYNSTYIHMCIYIYINIALSRSALIVPSRSLSSLPVLFPYSTPFRSLVRRLRKEKRTKLKREEGGRHREQKGEFSALSSFWLSLLVFFIFSFPVPSTPRT